jgi:hypothetical protein
METRQACSFSTRDLKPSSSSPTRRARPRTPRCGWACPCCSSWRRADRGARSTRRRWWAALGEEEQVGADAGVGIEDAVGQADDGVQVALGEQGFLDAGLDAFAEEGAVGQHESGAAAGLEDLHQQHEEEVGGLAGAELGGVVGLDAVLLHAAEGRVGDDDVHALLRPQSRRGRARVLSWRTLEGTSMPCSSRLVMHRTCGRCFFSMPAKQSWMVRSSASVLACLRRCSMAQTRKPPVPQAGSRMVSPRRDSPARR